MAAAPGLKPHRVNDPNHPYSGGDGARPMDHPDWGKPGKGVTPDSIRIRQKEDKENKSSPGMKRWKPGDNKPKPTPGKGKDQLFTRPDAFGDATKFEDDRRQWAQDHPDNKGGKVPTYTPPITDPKKSKKISPKAELIAKMVARQ